MVLVSAVVGVDYSGGGAPQGPVDLRAQFSLLGPAQVSENAQDVFKETVRMNVHVVVSR